MADVRLIDANALLEKECCGRISGEDVRKAPTIDPDDCRPRGRLGVIYVDEYYSDMAECLLCGGWNVPPCNYCSNCGAKIDGEEQSHENT